MFYKFVNEWIYGERPEFVRPIIRLMLYSLKQELSRVWTRGIMLEKKKNKNGGLSEVTRQ